MFTGLSTGLAVDDDNGDGVLEMFVLLSVVLTVCKGADELGVGPGDDDEAERFCNAEVLNNVDKLMVDIVVVVVYAAGVEIGVVDVDVVFLVVVGLVVVVFGRSVVEDAWVVVFAVVVLTGVVVVEVLLVVGVLAVVVVDFSAVESFGGVVETVG